MEARDSVFSTVLFFMCGEVRCYGVNSIHLAKPAVRQDYSNFLPVQVAPAFLDLLGRGRYGSWLLPGHKTGK